MNEALELLLFRWFLLEFDGSPPPPSTPPPPRPPRFFQAMLANAVSIIPFLLERFLKSIDWRLINNGIHYPSSTV